MKIFTSPKQKIGLQGEIEARMFLMKHGFHIIDKNFSTRFGEIDIIAKKDKRFHFIEIKSITVSCETESLVEIGVTHETNRNTGYFVSYETLKSVSRETFIKENKKLINPFQNISKSKIRRSVKTIECYLALKDVPRETRWQLDGIGVFIDSSRKIKIQYLQNLNIIS
jgi:putative endonuclease